VSVMHKTLWPSEFLVYVLSFPRCTWRLLLSLALITVNAVASGQQSEPQINVQLQSMTKEEFKRINEDIILVNPLGHCLAWLAFDTKNITTPVAIYDLWKGGQVMKINNGFVYSVETSDIDTTENFRKKKSVYIGFLQNLSYVKNIYGHERSSLLKNGYTFLVDSKNLKISAKKKKCTFANAQCRKYAGDFSMSISSLNGGLNKLLFEIPIGRLMIEDMCPVARGNGARNSPLRELSGLVEQSNLGRSSEKDYLNDLAANGIRQSWLKPYITIKTYLVLAFFFLLGLFLVATKVNAFDPDAPNYGHSFLTRSVAGEGFTYFGKTVSTFTTRILGSQLEF
jgi:hypothetical protein